MYIRYYNMCNCLFEFTYGQCTVNMSTSKIIAILGHFYFEQLNISIVHMYKCLYPCLIPLLGILILPYLWCDFFKTIFRKASDIFKISSKVELERMAIER